MILTEWCILVNDKRNGFMIKSETEKKNPELPDFSVIILHIDFEA